jgi:hypothetical protein
MTRLRSALLGAAAALAATVSAAPASALEIVYTDTSGGGAANGTQARFGFNVAKLFWESVLKDNVTVRLNIGFQALDEGVLAQAGSNSVGLLTSDTYGLLAADTSGALDAQAVASLRPLVPSATFPGALAVNAVVNDFVNPATRVGYQHGTGRLDIDGSANNAVLDVNTSVAKALGVTGTVSGVDLATASDADITFSSEFSFDFDPTDGIDDNSFDFIGIAIHEIGHALGFVSGVDIYDLVSRNNGPLAALLEGGAFGPDRNIEGFRVMSTLDLFRYGERSDDFGPALQLDWTTGGSKYFSIDGGQTELFGESNFSTGAFNGDGSQASHWIDNEYLPREGRPCSRVVTQPIGIMNPTIGRCEAGAVTALDLAAFDAIGWDLDFNVLARPTYSFTTAQAFRDFGEIAANIPEPATWAMMIAGFGFVGAAARRRTKVQVTYA